MDKGLAVNVKVRIRPWPSETIDRFGRNSGCVCRSVLGCGAFTHTSGGRS